MQTEHKVKMLVDDALRVYKVRHDLESPSRREVQIGHGSAMSLLFGTIGDTMIYPLLQKIEVLEEKTKRL